VSNATLPTFLGIGASRCATTWIHECLDRHPEVFVPEGKEVHFFDQNFDEGFDWYGSHFDDSYDVRGEYTPVYLYDEDAPQRVAQTLTDPGLIVSLRDPIDRARSLWGLHRRRGQQDLDFLEALESDETYLNEGRYYSFLENWLEYFERDDFLFLVYEDLQEDPEAFLSEIYDFLDVDTDFTPSIVDQRRNRGVRGEESAVSKGVRRFASVVREAPIVGSLVETIRNTDAVNTFLDRTIFSAREEGLSIEREQELKESVDLDTRSLSKLVDRDLSTVWQ
jgi:hypothetical protein